MVFVHYFGVHGRVYFYMQMLMTGRQMKLMSNFCELFPPMLPPQHVLVHATEMVELQANFRVLAWLVACASLEVCRGFL